MLSYLALQGPGSFCRRETLVGQLWPESDETKARANLSVTLHHLRRLVGKTVVITRGVEEIGLNPKTIWVDTWAFYASVDRGALEEAAGLYRGPLLDGLHVLGSASFTQFLEERRYRLRSTALAVFSELADRALEGGRPEGRKWLHLAYTLAPSDNRVAHRLMQLEARAGHPSLALQVYESLVDRMRQDLETEPLPETRALADAIRAGTFEAAQLDPLEFAPDAAEPPLRDVGTRPRRRVLPWVGLATLGTVLAVWAFSYAGGGRSPSRDPPPAAAGGPSAASEPRSTTILVIPPEDQTGDPELGSLADRVASASRRAVQQEAEVEVSPRLLPGQLPSHAAEDVRELLARHGATHALSGVVYGSDDSIHLSQEVLDRQGGTVRVLDEITAPRGSSDRIVRAAADQSVASILDLTFEDGFEFRYWSLPRTADAMRLYRQSMFHFNEARYGEATDLLVQAIEVEPTWPRPYWILRNVSQMAGRRAEVWPRYEARFEALRPLLSTDEQMYIEWQIGDTYEQRREVAERRFRLYDGISTTGYQLAASAAALGRLNQALMAIDTQNYDHAQIAEWPLAWFVRGQIYHLNEDYQRELNGAREGRTRMPNRFWFRFYEARALLALKQDEAALSVYSELVEFPTTAQSADPTFETRRLWNALHDASFEFSRHGSSDTAARALSVFAEWALGRDDLSRWQRAQTYYRLGRFREAIPLLEEEMIAVEGVQRVPVQALLVISLERTGDVEAAAEVERSIEYPPGSNNWTRIWQALPPAARGDVDRALEVLSRAYAEGVPRYPATEDFMHFRSELAALWNDTRFVRMMHPEER